MRSSSPVRRRSPQIKVAECGPFLGVRVTMRNGKPLVRGGTLADRVWYRVAKVEGDGCWLWQGTIQSNGYGRLDVGPGHTSMAHRLTWELTNGPIPDGMHVCHRCDNPPCVNPAHLFLGTRKDNMQDAVRKGRLHGWRGTQTHCDSGHEFTTENTKHTKRGKRRCRACDRERARLDRERKKQERRCA